MLHVVSIFHDSVKQYEEIICQQYRIEIDIAKAALYKNFMTSQNTDYFSDSYEEAREKILREFNAASNVRIMTYQHPEMTGPDGIPLITNVAWIGPSEARAILLISSGLHGAEGYAGSAIQLKALAEDSLGPLPEDMALVMVHAVNPYGFAYNRRVNENNIDLNRNNLDWSKEPPADHKLSDKIQSVLLPEKWNWPLILAKTVAFRLVHGMKGLQEAVTQGQYTHPNGLCYGGDAEAWSTKVMREIAEECSKHAEFIGHVDIHTGLGDYGHAELIIDQKSDDPAAIRAREWWGEKVKSPRDSESVAAQVKGSIFDLFKDVADKIEVTQTGLEFGTLGKFSVLKALVFDNWVYATGQTEEHGPKAREMMRNAFGPKDPVWEQAVLDEGIETLQKAKAGLEVRLENNPR